MKLLIATSIPNLGKAIQSKKKYDVVGIVDNIADTTVYLEDEVDCLLVTERVNVRGNLTDDIIRIKNQYPMLRIVFFASTKLNNEYSIRQAYKFIEAAIYDLYYYSNVQLSDIVEMLDHPRSKGSTKHIEELYNKTIQEQRESESGSIEDIVDLSRNNVYLFTSAKPGTGKSFIASNVAFTIAKYGKMSNGNKPRVLLVEGDLQNLSVSTLFGIQNKYHNLSLCLKEVQCFMQEHSLDDWNSDMSAGVKQNIQAACINSNMLENLDIIESHDFSFEEIAETDSSSYYYLVDYLSTIYDIVIVDGNTSIQHKTTDPLYQLSKTLYFVFTTDYSNLHRNIRYSTFLDELNLSDKTKYILNKADDVRDAKFNFTDDEIIDGHIDVSFKIPVVDISVMYNATYDHKLISNIKDFSTLKARLAFIKIANDIVRLQGMEELLQETEELKKAAKKKK